MDATDGLPQYRERRRRRSLLGSALARSVALECADRTWPRLLFRFLSLVRRSAQPEVAALIWTAARWGELPTIDWSRVAEQQPAMISMGKVGGTRPTPSPPIGAQAEWQRVDHPILLPGQSRTTVAEAVRVRLREMGLSPPPGVQGGTHAIRHLIGSAMHWRGAPVDVIADRLGHREEQTTAEYIHIKAAWRTA